MNASITYRLVTAAAAAWLLAAGAQAQQPAGRSRAEVQAEAIAAAHAPDQNVTRGSRGAEKFTPMADPQKVYEQAVATAGARDQNVNSGSRVNSRVISTMSKPTDRTAQTPSAPAK